MKVKQDVARTSPNCLCSSSKRYLYDTRIDKAYYGKCISLREKILLMKLFGALYDDITQTLPESNVKRKSSENLRLTEETIKVAKCRLISHALEIVNIDKQAYSKILSDSCGCCSYASIIPLCEHDRRLHRHGVYTSREDTGCRVETAKRVGKRQVKRIWSDLCTYKCNDWKEKEWRTETKQILHRNYVTVFDDPTFFKNYIVDRRTRLVNEITNENLTTFKRSTPISRAYKTETDKIPFENIENGMNESIIKQSPRITHRPPYNFMANPRLSLNKINNYEPNITQRFDKDATGDTILYETVTNIQPVVQRKHDKNYTYLIKLALRRCFCTHTLKPHDNKLDVITASKTVAKSLRHIIRTPASSQFKSISERSKIIKKTNKNNTAKVRHRSRKNLNSVKEKTNINKPKLEVHPSSYVNVRGNKDHPENNLNGGNNLLARQVKENQLYRNVFCVENTPHMSMNSERQSFISKKSSSPAAIFQFDAVHEALETKKLSEKCNPSNKCISHQYSLDCKPEIDKFCSTCQNVIDKKPQVLPYFNGCIPHKCFVSKNKSEPNEHRTSDCNMLEIHRSEPKSTISVIQNDIKYMETANMQTSLRSQINKISIDSILNQAVQVNSGYSFDKEFYEKKSPLLHDAHICPYGRQYREAGFQTIETHQECEEPRGNRSKTSETDSSYEKNVCIESDAQRCFCASKLHKMGGNILGTILRAVRHPRKGILSKKIQLKSFHQDNEKMGQDFGFFTDISCERSIPCTFNKENMATDIIIQSKSKRIRQRTKSNKIFSFPLINKPRQTKIRSYRSASSEIRNIEFSQNRKMRHTYVPIGKPYCSNKYRHDYRPIELLRERAVKCKTSFSGFSSIIGATTTTTSDSNRSFSSEKYKKYKYNTSHRVNSLYKSSFYAFNINVKNTRSRNRRSRVVRIASNFSFDVEFSKSIVSEKKLDKGAVPAPDFISERKQDKGAASMQTHSNRSVKQGTYTAIQRHHAESQSHADTQHVGINTHPKRCFCTLKLHKMGRVYREKGVAAKSYKPKPNVLKETGTVTTKENSNIAAKSNVLKETGTVTTNKNSNNAAKPNVLKETGTVTTKKNIHNAAVVELDLEPYECVPGTCIPGECDPQECLKRIQNRKNKTTAVGAQMATGKKRDTSSTMAPDQKKEISTIMALDQNIEISPIMAPDQKKEISPIMAPGQKKDRPSRRACRITSNFSFSIEFVEYKPGHENILPEVQVKPVKHKGLFKGLINWRSTVQKITCRCIKHLNIQNQNSNKSVQSNVKYQPDDIKKLKEVGVNSNINYRLADLDPYECEPGTCIPGECDPNECFEIIKRRGVGTDIKSKNTKERTTATHEKKDKKRKKVNEVVKYRLEDLGPYECEPGTCIPGECDPNECFEIIKKRGMETSIGTDVKSKYTNEGTTTTHKKKDKKRKRIQTKSVTSQGTKALRDHDSHVIPEHYQKPPKKGAILKRCFCTAKLHGIEQVIPEHYQKPSKTGATLKRCFCTAKLQGIEVPLELASPLLKSKKVKQKATQKKTKTNYTQKITKTQVGHSKNSQTINPAREFNLEPYECEPGVCVPGKCDPNICYERIKRRNLIQNISTQSNHDSKSVKVGKHRADQVSKSIKTKKDRADQDNKSVKTGKHSADPNSKSVKTGKHRVDPDSKSVKTGKHRADQDSKSVKKGKHRADPDSKLVKTEKHRVATSETEKRQDGDRNSKNLSPSLARIGSSFEFNVEFSRQISGMDGDGPDYTKKSNKKQKMVSGTEVPTNSNTTKQKMLSGTAVSVNPKTKTKGSGHLQPPVKSRDLQVVKKTAHQASGIGIVLTRCFCTLSLKDKLKK